MSWVRLDDSMPDSVKVEALSDAAFRVYVKGICYCSRLLTDGFIPDSKVREFTRGKPSIVKELTAPRSSGPDKEPTQLWLRVDDGYVIHDYLEYNPTREKVLTKRAEDSARKARGKKTDSAGTRARSTSHPIPSHPDRTTTTREGGELSRLDRVAANFAEFGHVTAGTVRAMDDSVSDYGIDAVELAVKRAAGSGFESKPPWSYVDSILERWKRQGGPDEPKERSNGRQATTNPTEPTVDAFAGLSRDA